jgi:hypothetical protein
MKKLMTGIIAGTILVSGSAMASKARLIALGQPASGSKFIQDERNIFLNSAQMHNNKDFASFEWGSDGATATDGTSFEGETDTAPQAEGGFITSAGNAVYGVWLGGESNTASAARNLSLFAGNSTCSAGTIGVGNCEVSGYQAMDNTFELFYGKDNGNQWGVSFLYSASEDDGSGTGSEQSLMATRLGFNKGNKQYYAIVGLTNETDDGAGNKYDGSIGVEVGAIMPVKNYNLAVSYQMLEGESDTATNDATLSIARIKVDLSREKKLTDKVTMWTQLGLHHDTRELEDATATATAVFGDETIDIQVPVSIAIEARVKDWLSIRGSISQNLMGTTEKDGDTSTIANSTDINVGAGFHFGSLTIDGLLGTGNDNAGNVVTSENEDGILSTDKLMTRVSMTYKW